MPKIELINTETQYMKVVKTFTINAFGIEIKVDKWCEDDALFNQYDNDYEIQDEKKVKEKLTEEQLDELDEFISELVIH